VSGALQLARGYEDSWSRIGTAVVWGASLQESTWPSSVSVALLILRHPPCCLLAPPRLLCLL
jgi:hypothetical protein